MDDRRRDGRADAEPYCCRDSSTRRRGHPARRFDDEGGTMTVTHPTPARRRLHNLDEIQEMITQADSAQKAWSVTPLAGRVAHVRRLGEVLRARREDLARLATMEMGKPIVQAEAEIDKCAHACDFYADKAEEFLRPTIVATSFDESYIEYDPLGIVLAVMPWNFPFWQ